MRKVESGSQILRLGVAWILGMVQLCSTWLWNCVWTLRLSTMMIWVFWFPSFPMISSGFICWLCGWRRTDWFWTLRSGFHPSASTWGFLLFHFIHHPSTTYFPTSHHLTHQKSLLTSWPPYRDISDCTSSITCALRLLRDVWSIPTGGLYHDLSDSRDYYLVVVANDGNPFFPVRTMGLANFRGSVRSRERSCWPHRVKLVVTLILQSRNASSRRAVWTCRVKARL